MSTYSTLCVTIYKLYTAIDVSNDTCVTQWMDKQTKLHKMKNNY